MAKQCNNCEFCCLWCIQHSFLFNFIKSNIQILKAPTFRSTIIFELVIQWKLPYFIMLLKKTFSGRCLMWLMTLGPCWIDNIDQKITISNLCSLGYVNGNYIQTWSIWLHKPIDNINHEHIVKPVPLYLLYLENDISDIDIKRVNLIIFVL